MKRIILFLLLLSAVLIQTTWADDGSDEKTLRVRQTATIQVEPDAILVRLIVAGQGMLTEDAIKNLEEKKTAILSALKPFDEISEITFARLAIRERGNRVMSSVMDQGTPNPEVLEQLLIQLPPTAPKTTLIVDEALRNGAIFSNPNVGGTMLPSSVLYALLEGV